MTYIQQLKYITIKFKIANMPTKPQQNSRNLNQLGLYDRIIQSLQQTIMSLQSDQILQQMRNDAALSQYKQGHIIQTLNKQLNYYQQLQELMIENQQLKSTVSNLQSIVQQNDAQFKLSIDNIQQSANKCLRNKQNEIKQLLNKLKSTDKMGQSHKHEIDILNKKNYQLAQFNQQYKEHIQQLQHQLQTSKHQLQVSKRQVSSIVNQLQCSNTKLSTLQQTNQQMLHQIKIQHSKQIKCYQQSIDKLQGDMLTIKNRWHQKCTQLQNNLRKTYEQKIFEVQQRKTQQLLRHIQQIKDGKENIVVKYDEQMQVGKVRMLRQQYQAEISQLRLRLDQAVGMYEQIKADYVAKSRECETTLKDCQLLRSTVTQIDKELEEVRNKSSKQNEKIKSIVRQYQKQQHAHDIAIKSIKKQLEAAHNKLGQTEQQLVKYQDNKIPIMKSKIEKLQNQIDNLYEQLRKKQLSLQQVLKHKQSKSIQLTGCNDKILQLVKSLQNQSKISQKKQQEIDKLKRNQQKNSIIIDNLKEKIAIHIKAIHKSLAMFKDDIKFSLAHIKNSILTARTIQLVEHVKQTTKQQYESRAKNKISQILDEFQENKEKQGEEFDEVLRQKMNLKREVEQLQANLQQKNREIEHVSKHCDQLARQLQSIKIQMKDGLNIHKQKCYHLQQTILHNQRQYHTNLDNAKLQVKDVVKKLSAKWSEQLNKLEQQSKKKDYQFIRLSDRTSQLLKQYEEATQKQQVLKEQSKRYRRRYEQYKNKSEQQIQDLLQRLQKESKHKLELDKQLRSIRTQLNNYPYSLNGHNARSPTRQNRIDNTQKAPNNNNYGDVTPKQKQFSDLKELVAKTYQIYKQPQRSQKPERDFRKKIMH